MEAKMANIRPRSAKHGLYPRIRWTGKAPNLRQGPGSWSLIKDKKKDEGLGNGSITPILLGRRNASP
eukprot:4100942-Karenia_brevis.AAC.1